MTSQPPELPKAAQQVKNVQTSSGLIVPTGRSERAAVNEAFRNAHVQSDVDTDRFAQHHTLGTGAYQAAAGNHTHNYFLEAHRVGAIYLTVDSTNPGELYGGTWVAWGSGRVPVGVDTGQAEFNTVEETGGFKTHTLTTGEIPAHQHGLSQVKYSAAYGGGGNIALNGTGTAITQVTDNAGGGGAHNNLQPYITCYMWKRTA